MTFCLIFPEIRGKYVIAALFTPLERFGSLQYKHPVLQLLTYSIYLQQGVFVMNVKPSTPNNSQTILFSAPILLAIMAIMFFVYVGLLR
jgi:hypothetical protein